MFKDAQKKRDEAGETLIRRLILKTLLEGTEKSSYLCLWQMVMRAESMTHSYDNGVVYRLICKSCEVKVDLAI